jgi:hypothetical protein
MEGTGMFSGHIREALAQVRQLQQSVLTRQQFRGYSGPARVVSGTAALMAAAIMSSAHYPATPRAHFLGWGAVFVFALILNGGALLYWFLNDPRVNRNMRRLAPILDSAPSLVVGGALTVMMAFNGVSQYLFGVWMCMFGLTNLASRYVLPRHIWFVGTFYVVCGVAWLLLPQTTFLNPWPMGVVFFAGELMGGCILYSDQRRYLALVRYQDIHEQETREREYHED